MLPLSPFDIDGWKRGDLREKMRIGALSWADVGFGAPPVAYIFYLLKHYFWLRMWYFFASYGSGAALVEQGWFTLFTSPDAMQRLVVWNLLFEVAGFGCASGPLTGRFLVPFPSLIHWLTPGTMKLPYRVDLRDGEKPLLPGAGTTRTLLDVGLYISLLGLCIRALVSPSIGFAECFPVIWILNVIGLFDVTVWLAARSEAMKAM